MRLLILGGTVFLGRAIAEEAHRRGHTVTLFNRGKSNPDCLPELERLRGERDGGLDALEGRTWDAVIDTCGYIPRIVRASARLLAPAVGHYTFISSISVYADLDEGADPDENGRLATTDLPETEEVTGETYGPLKALCEQAAEEETAGRALLVRPGLIVGPWDPTDRFTYWPVRAAEGGRLLAPGRPEAQVQVIDVRDLAGWIVGNVEAGTVGPANLVGPVGGCTMQGLLEASCDAGAAETELVWVPDEWLVERELAPWGDLPLWAPVHDVVARVERAASLGLETRPLTETARDTLAWRSEPERAEKPLRAGISRERMDALLAEWLGR